ncbi:MAG: CDP-diacylglycerol--serine O-phosphatidyltransferase [Terriglobales bacterium]
MALHLHMRRSDDRPIERRRLRKGMYLLPSLFTCLNIAAGYYAISQSIQGSVADPRHFDLAAIAIGIAVLFDGLDGRIARMTRTTSDFGRELDSLADVVTFGVAPALLAWAWGFRMLPLMPASPELRTRIVHFGAIATFLFLVAGAARLARFNIQLNPQPSNPGRPGRKYFVGMPIPAGAGIVAAVVHFSGGQPLAYWWEAAIFLVFLIALAFLMVSTWRFYSFKDIDLRRRHPFRLIVLIGALIAGIYFFSQWVLFILALVYMLSGVVARLFYVVRRRGAPPPSPPTYKEASELR